MTVLGILTTRQQWWIKLYLYFTNKQLPAGDDRLSRMTRTLLLWYRSSFLSILTYESYLWSTSQCLRILTSSTNDIFEFQSYHTMLESGILSREACIIRYVYQRWRNKIACSSTCLVVLDLIHILRHQTQYLPS